MRHLNTWSGNHQQSLGLLLLNLSSPAFRALFLLFNLPAGASVTNQVLLSDTCLSPSLAQKCPQSKDHILVTPAPGLEPGTEKALSVCWMTEQRKVIHVMNRGKQSPKNYALGKPSSADREQNAGFPGGTSGKESTCKCRRLKRCWFDPWRRSLPTPVFLSGEFPWTEEPGGLQPIGSQRSGT